MVFTPKFGKLVRRAVAAGGGSPVAADEADLVASLKDGKIPANWRDLDWPKLRSLAAGLSDSDGPVKNKADAVAAIEAYLAQ